MSVRCLSHSLRPWYSFFWWQFRIVVGALAGEDLKTHQILWIVAKCNLPNIASDSLHLEELRESHIRCVKAKWCDLAVQVGMFRQDRRNGKGHRGVESHLPGVKRIQYQRSDLCLAFRSTYCHRQRSLISVVSWHDKDDVGSVGFFGSSLLSKAKLDEKKEYYWSPKDMRIAIWFK